MDKKIGKEEVNPTLFTDINKKRKAARTKSKFRKFSIQNVIWRNQLYFYILAANSWKMKLKSVLLWMVSDKVEINLTKAFTKSFRHCQ